MNRKERILEYMRSTEYLPLKREELIAVLGVPKSDEAEFDSLLSELVHEGKVLPVKKSRFRAAEKGVCAGRLRCNKHGFFAFAEATDGKGEIFIGGEDLLDAVDGDFVAIMLIKSKEKGHMRDGKVIKVLERMNKTVTGVITKANKSTFFINPDNSGIYVQITAPATKTAAVGDRVVLEIKEYSALGDMSCDIIANLGRADDFKSCIEAAIFNYGIKTKFDTETLNEAQQVETEITDIGTRRDLRDLLTFTIDGDDARDFDDAVSCERLENNNFRVGVHIADVTHYVKEGSALDREAYERGTSVYLADRVIPMLPRELSNGICSLNPDVDRFTLSVFMEIDKTGNILSHELFKAVIHSKKRLTYNIAAELLEGEDEGLKKEYKKILPALKRMKRVANYLNKKRVKRGSINFDFPEAKVIVDESGEPSGVEICQRNVAHKIIEEFMLAANETVAEYAFWAQLPFVYRVHEAPETEKIEGFLKFASNFGIKVKGRTDKDGGIHPKTLQKITEEIKGMPEEEMISRYMLRSLMKAEYRPENRGHFGLAAKFYCHFTSPIRRYPDLTVHRILKDFLDGKPLDKYEAFVKGAAENSSRTERNAEMLERDVDDIMKAQYMRRYIGETFPARISGTVKFGIFAELENSIEGLIRLEDLHDDYYLYDEEKRIIIGERRHHIYKIGDPISVMIAKCDVLTGSIDFLPGDATIQNINRFYRQKRNQQNARQDYRRGAKRIANRRIEKKGRKDGRI